MRLGWLVLFAFLLAPLSVAVAGDYGCAQGSYPRRLPPPDCTSSPDCAAPPCEYPPVCVQVFVKPPCKKHCCFFSCEEPPRGEVIESVGVRRVNLPQRSTEITFARQSLRMGPKAEFGPEKDCRNSGGQESAADGLSDQQRIQRLEKDITNIDGKLNDLLGLIKQQQAILNAHPPK